MKKVMALAAIALLASTGAHALVGLEGLSWDGSLEVSGFSANNESDSNSYGSSGFADTPDHRGGANTRVRVGVNADVTEDVKGRIEFTRTGRQYGTGATTLTSEQGLIKVQNAYIDIDKLWWGLNARLGRQYVGAPGDLVWRVGPLEDDAMSVNAIDGLSITRNWDFIGFNVFTGKASEDESSVGDTDTNDVTGAGDINVSAIHAWLPTILPGGKIWLGLINGVDNNGAAQGANRLNIGRVGANGGILENLLTYRAEFLQDMGQNKSGATKVKYKGSALDLGLGLNVPENRVGSIGIAADYDWASGDDKKGNNEDKSFRDLNAIGLNASDRYFGEIWGKSNAFGGGGAAFGNGLDTGSQSNGYQIIHLDATLKPAFATKTWWKIDFFDLGADKGKDYGREYDFTAGYKHTDNVGFEAGYGLFHTNKDLVAAGVSNKDTTKLFGKVKVKWGGSAS